MSALPIPSAAPAAAQASNWDSVLPALKAEPRSEDGKRLAQLLVTPPPLPHVEKILLSIKKFTGVPEAPSPLMGKDKFSFHTHVKIEGAMNLIIQAAEDPSPTPAIAAAVALMRSAFEDILLNRKRDLGVFVTRTDVVNPILTETDKKNRRKRPQGRGRFNQGNDQGPPRGGGGSGRKFQPFRRYSKSSGSSKGTSYSSHGSFRSSKAGGGAPPQE
eukprot:TRINITY_DN3161_c0_g1_i11.p1 TRINITY_DN3161_c0_g1~~TRINITY_DN3161_c0_g1_i11.p1  ORF type:complete len:216 (+),score=20.07 TRINITY_DN3161_c0_g1_i11:336-983(+)